MNSVVSASGATSDDTGGSAPHSGHELPKNQITSFDKPPTHPTHMGVSNGLWDDRVKHRPGSYLSTHVLMKMLHFCPSGQSAFESHGV